MISSKFKSLRARSTIVGMLFAITQVMPLAYAGEAFSIVSMTLHDEALAGAHDVEIDGNLAFVPGKRNSLSIIDISNPKNPNILWYLNDSSIPDAETVLPVEGILLLGTEDFLSLDIQDPRNPRILKKLSNHPRIDKINGMMKSGNYVITANKSGYVTAFDVSDLTNPVLYGSLETKDQFGLSLPHDIDGYGDYIVIVDPNGFVPPVGKMGIIKVMNRGRVLPVDEWILAGKLQAKELIGANRVQVKGNYAFTGGSYTLKARETNSEPSRMTIVDISNPTDPAIVASLPFTDVRGPNGLTIAGNIVFCAGGQTVCAYDISDPENPIQVASQSFPIYRHSDRTDNYHDLIYRDGYLYVSAQSDNGFLILKVENEEIRKLADAF